MANRRKELEIGDKALWYLVGLVATDGCLSSDGRHIDITSKDRQLLTDIRKALILENKIGRKFNGQGRLSFHIQIGNRNLYDFLMSIGLKQKKSLVLEELQIPAEFFRDFIRGIIDGDGSIRRWLHPSNKKEQWSLRIYSGAPIFIHWLRDLLKETIGANGRIHKESDTQYILKYGKMAAREITRECYYEGCLGLKRKIKLAQACSSSYRGWKHSFTIQSG